jgi:hypothetical protein
VECAEFAGPGEDLVCDWADFDWIGEEFPIARNSRRGARSSQMITRNSLIERTLSKIARANSCDSIYRDSKKGASNMKIPFRLLRLNNLRFPRIT